MDANLHQDLFCVHSDWEWFYFDYGMDVSLFILGAKDPIGCSSGQFLSQLMNKVLRLVTLSTYSDSNCIVSSEVDVEP